MKLIVSFALVMIIGLMMAAAGCIAITNKNSVNATNATTAVSFVPFSNTSDSGANKTLNTTGNVTIKLKGPLRVSISGYPADLPVVVDNKTVGMVSKEKPLDLMLDEGFHVVEVCVGVTCEKDTVPIIFAKKSYVDFGERLRKDVDFPLPTARIVGFFKNGNRISVNVEFINPTTKPLTINAAVSCGYNYVDTRTNVKLGDSAQGNLVQLVEAGQRITQPLDLNFAGGHNYNYDAPTITDITIK